jgi:hypothetical protein
MTQRHLHDLQCLFQVRVALDPSPESFPVSPLRTGGHRAVLGSSQLLMFEIAFAKKCTSGRVALVHCPKQARLQCRGAAASLLRSGRELAPGPARTWPTRSPGGRPGLQIRDRPGRTGVPSRSSFRCLWPVPSNRHHRPDLAARRHGPGTFMFVPASAATELL